VQSSLDVGYSTVKEDGCNPVQLAIREMARKIASDLLSQQDTEQQEAQPTLLKRLWRRRGEKTAPTLS
jgi:hypothetical protein